MAHFPTCNCLGNPELHDAVGDAMANAMALIQVSQISFASEVCGVKLRHFYIKIVNK